MNIQTGEPFVIPDIFLSALPTGAVKQTVDQLGRQIAMGSYQTGAPIPTEAELAEHLGVSRTVVREAVKVLSGKGMVRTARRYGSRVMPFDDWNLVDPDVIRWHDQDSPMSARIYAESTELRYIVEPEAAAMAAFRASDAQRETILRAAHMITPEPHGLDGMVAADYAFHATILEGSGNIMLAQLQRLILAVLLFCYPTAAKRAPDEKVSRQAHIRVAEAITARDGDAARRLMQDMLDQNRSVARRLHG